MSGQWTMDWHSSPRELQVPKASGFYSEPHFCCLFLTVCGPTPPREPGTGWSLLLGTRAHESLETAKLAVDNLKGGHRHSPCLAPFLSGGCRCPHFPGAGLEQRHTCPPVPGTEMSFLPQHLEREGDHDSNHMGHPPLRRPWKGVWRLWNDQLCARTGVGEAGAVHFSKWRVYQCLWKKPSAVSLKTYSLLASTKKVWVSTLPALTVVGMLSKFQRGSWFCNIDSKTLPFFPKLFQ